LGWKDEGGRLIAKEGAAKKRVRVGLRGRAVDFKKSILKKCVDKNERERETQRKMRERVRVGEGGGCAWKDKACEDVIRKNGSF
jgi:hypothetical protein